NEPGGDRPVAFGVFSLPLRDQENGPRLAEGGRTIAARAFQLACAAVVGIRWERIYMVVTPNDRFRSWGLMLPRAIGWVLLFILAATLANTLPVLRAFFATWLLP